jgi:biopolymer transport protein TolR
MHLFSLNASSLSGRGRGKWESRSRIGGDPKGDMNLTPLIDVVLVLLIIFMVITPLLQLGYDVVIPPKLENQDPTNAPEQVIVSVLADGAVYINKDEIKPASSLSTRLAEIVNTRRVKIVFFSCDEKFPYGESMKVLDTIKNCRGSENPVDVGIVLQPVSPIDAAPA